MNINAQTHLHYKTSWGFYVVECFVLRVGVFSNQNILNLANKKKER